jgi:hypothetical protein
MKEKLRRENKLHSKYEKALGKYEKKQEYKKTANIEYALKIVREYAREDTWCTSHANCFRASFGLDNKAESEAHLNKKFELWCEYRRLGFVVYCELILKDGRRPDLVIVGNNGTIEIIEIYESESSKSLENKESVYPFPVRAVRA